MLLVCLKCSKNLNFDTGYNRLIIPYCRERYMMANMDFRLNGYITYYHYLFCSLFEICHMIACNST